MHEYNMTLVQCCNQNGYFGQDRTILLTYGHFYCQLLFAKYLVVPQIERKYVQKLFQHESVSNKKYMLMFKPVRKYTTQGPKYSTEVVRKFRFISTNTPVKNN